MIISLMVIVKHFIKTMLANNDKAYNHAANIVVTTNVSLPTY
jgi:hypothetical protein